MKEFKIRASAVSQITGGTIGLTVAQEAEIERLEAIPKTKVITEKQLETLEELRNAESLTPVKEKKLAELEAKSKEFKKLTPSQEESLKLLYHKRDNPVLPEGLKTYCKKWYKGYLTGKKGKNISNKYTEKGTVMEDAGIDLIAEIMGYGMLIKNTHRYTDDPDMEGEPDILPEDQVIDNKSSWDIDTFPMFETKIPTIDYWWQLQAYMAMTGKPKATLAYTLVDNPDNLIEAQAWKECRDLGMDELDADIYDKVKHELTFSDVALPLRVRLFDVERDEEAIQEIRNRVAICRDYIENTLKPIVWG